jgi:DNA-binding CsgD family transcriptional regulator
MKHDGALAIVGRIYEAAQDGTAWPELLIGIADFCGGANAALVMVDPDISYASVITPRANPDSLAAYNDHWWRQDPITVLAAKAPPGQFVSIADLDREAYFSSAFYNEFRRYTGYGDHGLTTTLFRERNAFGNFVLQTSRQKDEIDAKSLHNAMLVVPHIERAVSISRKLRRLELEQAARDRKLRADHAGMILVDSKGQCLYADDEAEELLAAEAGVRTVNGHVRLEETRADLLLTSAIRACGLCEPGQPCGSTLQVIRGASRPPLTVEVLPHRKNPGNPHALPAAAMLLFRDPGPGNAIRTESLRRRFGLTPAEAALAIEMLEGDGRSAAAARCGITINTARTHLSRIFEKTGVKRQAELIRVLMDCDR